MKNIFILFILTLFGCKEKSNVKNNVPDEKPMNYQFIEGYNNRIKIDSLCKRIMIDGDTLAFRELKYIYMVSEHSQEFLYFSTVMAEKHNYGPAFQINYDILKDSKEGTVQKIAIYNLIRAYEELGDRSNIKKLKEMFPKGIPKSDEYWNINNKDNVSD